jgi:serine/threonine protein kinase
MQREAQVQSKLRHPNIVLLIAMVFEERNYGVILEYMKYGDLKEFLDCFKTPWQFKLHIALDVAVGMCYLHGQKVVHGDLKIQNILIGEGFRAKVPLNSLSICVPLNVHIRPMFVFAGLAVTLKLRCKCKEEKYCSMLL